MTALMSHTRSGPLFGSPHQRDLWRWPTVVLWAIFFLAGLAPEWTFGTLRELALVSTRKAMVNSYIMVTFGLAAYLAMFTFHRCREASISTVDAYGKALRIGLLAVFAFLPVSLEEGSRYQDIPVASLRWTYLSLVAAKYLAWLFLTSIVLRYYFIDGHRVFRPPPGATPNAPTAEKESKGASSPQMPVSPVHETGARENPGSTRDTPR